jgi:Holliday junction resolvase
MSSNGVGNLHNKFRKNQLVGSKTERTYTQQGELKNLLLFARRFSGLKHIGQKFLG